METTKDFKERIKNNHKVVNLLRKLNAGKTLKEVYEFVFSMDDNLLNIWIKIANKQNSKIAGGNE